MEAASTGLGASSPEENLIEQARFYIEHERWTQAEPLLRQAITASPDDPLPRAWLAVTLGRLNRRDDALREARTAVGMAPEWPYAHLVAGYLWDEMEKHGQSEASAREALRLAPDYADAYALLAQSLFHQGRWNEALSAAEHGLEADASDVACANLRAMALTKLRRRDDASAALDTALAHDPENALTHANRGWALLEANRHREAMEAFKEALRLDPQQEWARQGILRALNARNPLYRVMLGYFFWMTRLRPQVRTGVIVGLWILNQVLRSVERANPAFSPYLRPILSLYLLWVLLTWTADPLFNLMLRFDPIGRYVLSDQQKRLSSAVGICVLVGLAAVITYIVTQSLTIAGVGFLGVFAVYPVVTFLNSESRGLRWVLGILSGLLGCIALALIVSALFTEPLSIGLMSAIVGGGIGIFALLARRN